MSETYLNLNVKCPFLFSIITQKRIHRQILVKIPSTKFHGNPSSKSSGASHGRTDGQTNIHDTAKSCFSQLFCEFANNGWQFSPTGLHTDGLPSERRDNDLTSASSSARPQTDCLNNFTSRSCSRCGICAETQFGHTNKTGRTSHWRTESYVRGSQTSQRNLMFITPSECSLVVTFMRSPFVISDNV
jgi:hypothetical protein